MSLIKRRRGERILKESGALPGYRAGERRQPEEGAAGLQPEEGKSRDAHWRIGQEVGLGDLLIANELAVPRGKTTATIRDMRNKLVIAASRKRRTAKAMIEGVGSGRFPVYIDREERAGSKG